MGWLGTRRRPPEVSSTAFPAHLPDVHTRPLMDVDFAVTCPLVRPGMPQIRFLFVRSRICSTLLSVAASQRRPCASLALHLHQVVQGTCTPQLSNMLGTQQGAVGAGGGEAVRPPLDDRAAGVGVAVDRVAGAPDPLLPGQQAAGPGPGPPAG